MSSTKIGNDSQIWSPMASDILALWVFQVQEFLCKCVGIDVSKLSKKKFTCPRLCPNK